MEKYYEGIGRNFVCDGCDTVIDPVNALRANAHGRLQCACGSEKFTVIVAGKAKSISVKLKGSQ